MLDGVPEWHLEDFLERLDDWAEHEGVPDDLKLIVTAWIFTRMEDPYRGVRLVENFPNLWFGVVPRTSDGSGRYVTCTYWIQETRRAVRCDIFGWLHSPFA